MKKLFLFILIAVLPLAGVASSKPMPRLEQRGKATQLIVDGKPFIILGGELGNSSVSSRYYMEDKWGKLKAMGLNTVLAPVYWELIEPEEGRFDFSSVDYLLGSARENDMKVVVLWFGTWKNSMSCYVPMWVKKQFNKRFPLACTSGGRHLEIMSAFSEENLGADKRAFTALMEYIKKADSQHRTVIMVQVENEIGMLESAREYGPVADKAYDGEVPGPVTDYIKSKKDKCRPHLYGIWKKNGSKTKGTWKEVFGNDLYAQELFMAYHYGRYVEEIAKAGKSVYGLPMYLNAALNSRGREPGQYPSAGPLAHLIDIWNVAAPSIDMLSPDIYDPGYTSWITSYTMPGNPLFIPEIRMNPENGAQVFFALGACSAIGFSPFSIEDADDAANFPLTKAYAVLRDILPWVTAAQSGGRIYGVWFDKDNTETSLDINGVRFTVKHDLTLGWGPEAKDKDKWSETGALIIDNDNDEFTVAGTGVVMTMAGLDDKEIVGIGEINELVNKDGSLVTLRRMNGDQDHQGRHLRIPFNTYGIQTMKLYRCGK